MLLSEARLEFIEHMKSKGRSPRSWDSYNIDLRRFGRCLKAKYGHELDVDEVKSQDLEGYLKYLLGLGLAPASRRFSVYILRSFFKYCHHIGAAKANPAADLEPVTIPKRLPVYLDASEVQLFLDRCHDPLVKAVVGTLYYTGLRISELCGLRVADVDLRRGTLRVTGKGSKERVVPLNAKCRDILLRYLVNVRPEVSSDSFFITQRRKLLESGWAAELVRREVKRQGWTTRITPHTFRHSCATALCQRGVPVPAVAQLLGHSSIQTTMIYTHLTGENLRDAVDRLC